MMHPEKYTRQFFEAPDSSGSWMKKTYIEKAPVWCSVDLRDGNQALEIPMDLHEKLEFFSTLVSIGLKEIEIGFPAASETEYEFCRALIEEDLIPDDVTIQVLTQSREHIIEKTFEALKGCKKAIVHLYNPISPTHREQVFRMTKEEICEIAVTGARRCKEYSEKNGCDYRFEYSPEFFSGSEPEFALEVCNAVLDVWQPTPARPVIINLPDTVQVSMPHVFANQVAYMCANLKYRDSVIVSLHPHNDRGCAVADAEMGLLAGADRVEGTLFGNGERTGNVDLITLALNMYSQGVDPQLDFSDIPAITEMYTRVTRMDVSDRQPYTGKLVYAAFSGSHQDAIAKALKWRSENGAKHWTVPYLPIDPDDIGRVYDGDVIRINSQSGKGGIGYILETKFGYNLPKRMREKVGYLVKGISDREHRELQPAEVFEIFQKHYINLTAPLNVTEVHFVQHNGIEATIDIEYKGEIASATNSGNGRLDAVSNAVRSYTGLEFTLHSYTEHALEVGSSSQAVSYVEITSGSGAEYWGTGIDNDIITSSIKAFISAINNMLNDIG